MPLPAPPTDLLAQINAKKDKTNNVIQNPLLSSIQRRQKSALSERAATGFSAESASPSTTKKTGNKPTPSAISIPPGKLFIYDDKSESFHFDLATNDAINVRCAPDTCGIEGVNIIVPLAPCVYRMTDYTYAKKEPILLSRCVNKLGVLRCLFRECKNINSLIWSRLSPVNEVCLPDLSNDLKPDNSTQRAEQYSLGGSIEEDELGKARFMELLSNCGVYQKVVELTLSRCNDASDSVSKKRQEGNTDNPFCIPQIRVEGLAEFLNAIEDLVPQLAVAREEITKTQTVSFHPGLGELFSPGAKLICYPEGMEGTPLGVSCVQSWYDEELNRATNKLKRRFILVVEFMVSVGQELVFVAASEVYPEFHDAGRNLPVRDLNHRRLDPENNDDDRSLLQRLQNRGEFYASVSTDNHYLEYHPNAFFPIIGGWGNNAVRPLSKGGRVMVDVHRGALEGHIPIRGSSDGMSDTVKEAMKLFDQSKRTGVAVPFRTAILHRFDQGKNKPPSSNVAILRGGSDENLLWMTWPMLTGFSFTARCWGKLLLSLPKPISSPHSSFSERIKSPVDSPIRPSLVRMGVSMAALGGIGQCGNVNYIKFQEQAFEQLVLAEDKKELIRAVARNAGGGSKFDFESEQYEGVCDEDGYDDDEIGLDVVANKGAASIFLLSGPPGCGKTLTAEAIAELLKKPLYVVTAGDLGITASEVEKSLGGVLDLCSTWDALVLIDEADIFLEARSSTEIQRNALVCVMLRLLEYYSGCLFLSSNRNAKSIDAAIASRITVMLSYPPLDVNGRAKVWKNLIELVPPRPVDSFGEILPHIANNPRRVSKYRMDFTADEYQNLASGYLLNGRQIKNSIVLARALARERGVPLSLDVLRRAVMAVAGQSAALPTESS